MSIYYHVFTFQFEIVPTSDNFMEVKKSKDDLPSKVENENEKEKLKDEISSQSDDLVESMTISQQTSNSLQTVEKKNKKNNKKRNKRGKSERQRQKIQKLQEDMMSLQQAYDSVSDQLTKMMNNETKNETEKHNLREQVEDMKVELKQLEVSIEII